MLCYNCGRRFWNSTKILKFNCSHKIFELFFKLTGKRIIIFHLCALQDWEQEDTPWDTTPIIHGHLVRNKFGSLPSIFLVKIIFHLLTLTFSHDFLKQRTLVVDRRHLTRNIYFAEQFSCQNPNKIRINFKLLLIMETTATNSRENVMNRQVLTELIELFD